MSKLSFDSKVNSSEFIEKTEQIRSAIRDTAQSGEVSRTNNASQSVGVHHHTYRMVIRQMVTVLWVI